MDTLLNIGHELSQSPSRSWMTSGLGATTQCPSQLLRERRGVGEYFEARHGGAPPMIRESRLVSRRRLAAV